MFIEENGFGEFNGLTFHKMNAKHENYIWLIKCEFELIKLIFTTLILT